MKDLLEWQDSIIRKQRVPQAKQPLMEMVKNIILIKRYEQQWERYNRSNKHDNVSIKNQRQQNYLKERFNKEKKKHEKIFKQQKKNNGLKNKQIDLKTQTQRSFRIEKDGQT